MAKPIKKAVEVAADHTSLNEYELAQAISDAVRPLRDAAMRVHNLRMVDLHAPEMSIQGALDKVLSELAAALREWEDVE